MAGEIVEYETISVLETPEGFLSGYLESWECDIVYYHFSKNPLEGYRFEDRYHKNAIPPRLWNNESNLAIYSLEEMCEYFEGRIIELNIKTTVQWEEVEK